MLPISSGHRSSSITLLRQHLSCSKSLHCPLRTYAASPQPRPYHQPKPAPKSLTGTKSASFTKSSPIPLQSIRPVETPYSRINPPTSTLPPPLKLPARTCEDGRELEWYRYYYRLGRAYGGFYMAGLKAIWANYKRSRDLLKALPSASVPAVRQAVREGTLSRADFQLIRRSKNDMAKLPPFILLWCICGEFTPLVIVFVTGLVPRTLWIPKQVQMAREKAEERRRTLHSKSGLTPKPIVDIIKHELTSSSGATVRKARKYVAQSLQLYPPWWDRFAPSLIPSGLIRRRVYARLKDLDVDDFAIARDGGVLSMNRDEVLMACEERGTSVLGKDDSSLREELDGWVEERTRDATKAAAEISRPRE